MGNKPNHKQAPSAATVIPKPIDGESVDGLTGNFGDVPELPEYARLTEEKKAEAMEVGSWFDDYVDFATKASPMTPKSFHYASSLFASSLAIARRICLRVSVRQNTIYPNLYMLFVGHSTTPRKTTGLKVVSGLIDAADMNHFLLASRQTPEALTLDLTTQDLESYKRSSTTQKVIWLKERAIAAQRGWLLDEASHLVDSFDRDYTSGLLPIVLDLYDSSDSSLQRNTIGRGRENVENAYLTIFGATTYGAIAENMRVDKHWHNGLWARFAFVGVDRCGAWKFWPPRLDFPKTLVDRLRFVAYELLPMPKAKIVEQSEDDSENNQHNGNTKEVVLDQPLTASDVEIDSDAWDHWGLYAKATSYDMLIEDSGYFASVPDRFYANYGRLSTMLIKVAMNLATFETESLPVVIRAAHIYRAQIIVEAWRAYLHRVYDKLDDIRDNTLAEKIMMKLAQNGPKWMIRRDLLRKMNKKWSQISDTVADLKESDQIEERSERNKRGPATISYRLKME